MTELDLLDRMAESTTWTQREPIDPTADVSRGRRRLRLRRRRLGLTTAGLAVAATVAGVVVAADPPAAQAPVATASPGPTVPDTTEASKRVSRLAAWFTGRIDPQRRYITHTEGGGAGLNTKRTHASMHWQQGTGHGHVAVSVTPPGLYDTATTAVRSSECLVFGRKAAAGPPYDCRWTTRDGRRVLIGTSDLGGVRSYFASYLRPDGYLVLAAVEGDRRWAFTQSVRPGGEKVVYPPVRGIAVALDDLVAAVTDPAVPLG